jgi:hypothetical protein
LTALALTGRTSPATTRKPRGGARSATKIALANRRINIGVAAFYNKLSDVQLTRSLPPSAPGQTTPRSPSTPATPAPRASELELFARPARGLDLQFGYSLADAKFTRAATSTSLS